MWNRRHFIAVCSSAGLAGTLLPFRRVLYTMAREQARDHQRNVRRRGRNRRRKNFGRVQADFAGWLERGATAGYEQIFALHMPNKASRQPALVFDPLPMGWKLDTVAVKMRASAAPAVATKAPKNIEDVAFSSVRELAELVRTKKVSSMALTEMYLERLKRYNPKLHFLITSTDDRAKDQAKTADAEIAKGKYRGLLHGIPWGGKDLLAVKGYPTTWGAGGFEKQTFDEDAEVVQRLDKAGAVLIAKLTLGALAQGDHWYGGITRAIMESRAGFERIFSRPLLRQPRRAALDSALERKHWARFLRHPRDAA